MVESLGRRAQFDHIRAHGSTVREGRLRIAAAMPPIGNESPEAGLAFAISGRNCTAVQRNRARRRLRAVFGVTERGGDLAPNWYLVTLHSIVPEPTYAELQEWVEAALDRLGPQPGGSE